MSYNTDMIATAIKIAEQFKNIVSPLDGECYNASFALGIRLATNGIPSKIVEGEFLIDGKGYRHFWLQVKGYIIDLTAGQFFGTPEVIAGWAKDLPQYKFVKNHCPDFERIAQWLGFNVREFGELETHVVSLSQPINSKMPLTERCHVDTILT